MSSPTSRKVKKKKYSVIPKFAVGMLWRDSWLKPLSDFEVGSASCKYCRKAFAKIDFVTSCEFCDIGIMHDACANKHIFLRHKKQLLEKIGSHKDKPLHDFQ
jgi:hypothetical protein